MNQKTTRAIQITKTKITKIFSFSLVLTLMLMSTYGLFEAGLVDAAVDTDSVNISLTVDEEITISSPADATLGSQNLSVSNSTASASTQWTVITNALAGYTLTVQATSSPALVNTASSSIAFANYTEAVPLTPEAWSVSGAYEFGFSAYGAHVPTATWGTNQASCGTDGPLVGATRKYQGFDGTNATQIASSDTYTTTSGTPSTVCWAVEQQGVFAPSGSYRATVVATATTQ